MTHKTVTKEALVEEVRLAISNGFISARNGKELRFSVPDIMQMIDRYATAQRAEERKRTLDEVLMLEEEWELGKGWYINGIKPHDVKALYTLSPTETDNHETV